MKIGVDLDEVLADYLSAVLLYFGFYLFIKGKKVEKNKT